MHVIVCHQVIPTLDGHLDTKAIPETQQLMGLECDVEVEGRLPIASHICCRLIEQCRGCYNAITSLSKLPCTSLCAIRVMGGSASHPKLVVPDIVRTEGATIANPIVDWTPFECSFRIRSGTVLQTPWDELIADLRSAQWGGWGLFVVAFGGGRRFSYSRVQ